MSRQNVHMITESAILKRVWADGRKRLRYTAHAREEMVNDAITDADVRHVIPRNGVCWSEMKRDLLWHVEGRDLDGRSIRIVLTVYEADIVVKVVTVMAL